MTLYRVKDHDGLYKDSSTGAVINKENDIHDIKSLLLKVLESNGQ